MKNTVTILIALLFVPPAALHAADVPTHPNILFIMVDEMKWNVMGCAGHEIVKTPHLDQLAREGTRFATAYTVAAICVPSRYSAFTSRYAHVHGSTDNSTPIRAPQLILPSILKHAGYQTAIAGKLHFIRPNNVDYGFDFFWSYADEGPGKLPTWPRDLEKKYGRAGARRLDPRPFPDDALGKDLGRNAYPKEDSQTFWITARAVDFLDQRNKDAPFFLFVSYLDPHSPSHLSAPYWNMYDAAKMPLPPTFRVDPAKPAVSAANRHEVNNPEIVKAMTAAYYAKVTMIDDNIGRLLDELAKRNLADNTLVIFTADHGNMLGDHNRWFKGVMYDGSSRIPLLMKAPPAGSFRSTFNRGAVVSRIVENIDIMPTVCEIAGVPLPEEGIQGRSMTGLVAGRDPDWKDRAFSERGSSMIRTPRYKLICNDRKTAREHGDYELYDMAKDPMETTNLASDPGHAEVLKDLLAKHESWQKDIPPVPAIPGVAPEPRSGITPDAEKPAKARRNRSAGNAEPSTK